MNMDKRNCRAARKKNIVICGASGTYLLDRTAVTAKRRILRATAF